MLLWIARFRFVDASVLSARFAVSPQQINARIRRLEAAGLVERRRDRTAASSAIATTRAAARALGLPERKPPRTIVQREHELAVAQLVATLETSNPKQRVLTERDCRQLERRTKQRYSADAVEPGRGPARRWPDIVIEHETNRTALELELSPKGTARLRAIIAGYVDAAWFDEVRFLTDDPSIARRLHRLLAEHGTAAARELFPAAAGPTFRVGPSAGALPD